MKQTLLAAAAVAVLALGTGAAWADDSQGEPSHDEYAAQTRSNLGNRGATPRLFATEGLRTGRVFLPTMKVTPRHYDYRR